MNIIMKLTGEAGLAVIKGCCGKPDTECNCVKESE